MAPRVTSRRIKPELEENSVTMQKSPSKTSTITTATSSSKRHSQPLRPSTSQNSVIKSSQTKRTSLRKSLSQMDVEPPPRPEPKGISKENPILNVYVFGSGSMGELGLGPLSAQRNVKRPRLNQNLLPNEVGVVELATGGMHCAAIDRLGRVWTWGVNDQGVLGRDTTWSPDTEDVGMETEDEDEEKLNPKESIPGLVDGIPQGTVIEKIACGDSISVAVTSDGQVYAWGTFRVSIFMGLPLTLIVFRRAIGILTFNDSRSSTYPPPRTEEYHRRCLWSRSCPCTYIFRTCVLLGQWPTTPTRSSRGRTNASE